LKVTVRFHGYFSEEIGFKETMLELKEDNCTLSHVVEKLTEVFGEKAGFIKRRISSPDGARLIILVNGRNAIYTGWLNTEIRDGDRIDIIPPLVGGFNLVRK